jgi:hypothetical protein
MEINDLQAGKAGEYLVCADLIIKGYVAFLSEQGLPFDIVMQCGDKLLKVQVKTTRALRNVMQRKTPIKSYMFNIKRCGKGNKKRNNESTCELFALVALDTKQIGYLINKNVRQTMNFRPDCLKGEFRDENTNRIVIGRYLSDMTLEKALCELAKF